MKRTLSYAMIFSVIFMTGCDQKEYKTPAERGVSTSSVAQTPSTASTNQNSQTATATTAEEQELKDIVAKMKQQDPSIVDAYYSVDASGQKILNLVKEEAGSVVDSAGKAVESATSGSGLSTFMWAMAGGLTANALYNAFSNNKGNMAAMNNQYRPVNVQRGNYASYQAQKQTAVSQYRSSFKPVTNVNNRNALAPSKNIVRPVTAPTNAVNSTTNKFSPVTPNATTGAPLSREAYRTQVVTRPKSTTSSYQSAQPVKKTTVFKRSGSIFKKRR